MRSFINILLLTITLHLSIKIYKLNLVSYTMNRDFEDIKIQFTNWLSNSLCVDSFKEIYSSSEIFVEQLDSGRIVHRAYTPFTSIKSNEPPVYLFENYFFDFESGSRGNTKDLIMHHYSPLSPKEQIKFLSRKTEFNVANIIKTHPAEWEHLLLELDDFYLDIELQRFSQLGLNPIILTDGTWVNQETYKHEIPKEYYFNNFNNFDSSFQQTILRYMPSVKKEIEKQNTHSVL